MDPLEFTRQQLSDEHKTLLSLLDRLKQAEHAVDLEHLLEELHTTLINHFSHEQFPGGLYESMGAYGPVHHDELRVLIKEHCQILSAIGALLEKVRVPGQKSELLDGVATLVARLGEHERKEHRLADKLLSSERK